MEDQREEVNLLPLAWGRNSSSSGSGFLLQSPLGSQRPLSPEKSGLNDLLTQVGAGKQLKLQSCDVSDVSSADTVRGASQWKFMTKIRPDWGFH